MLVACLEKKNRQEPIQERDQVPQKNLGIHPFSCSAIIKHLLCSRVLDSQLGEWCAKIMDIATFLQAFAVSLSRELSSGVTPCELSPINYRGSYAHTNEDHLKLGGEKWPPKVTDSMAKS